MRAKNVGNRLNLTCFRILRWIGIVRSYIINASVANISQLAETDDVDAKQLGSTRYTVMLVFRCLAAAAVGAAAATHDH